jgi:hypothetical protein
MMKLTDTLIGIAILILVIFLVILIFSGAFNQLLKPLLGEKLTDEEEIEYENNFDKVTENLKTCKDMQDEICICEVFPDFTGIFKGELHFVSEGKDINLALKIGNQEYFSEKIEDLFVSSFKLEDQTDFNNIIPYSKDNHAKRWINFNKNPPKFDNARLGGLLKTAEPNLVSGFMFKIDKDLYFILSDRKPEEVKFVIDDLKICEK